MTSIPAAASTAIDVAIAPGLAAHGGQSGFHALRDGEEAFAARIALIDAATRELDLQTYIWRDDVTGRLVFDAVCRAAARGVRVRLLLDDNNTGGLDPLLAALDALPNVEVRLFNPFRRRRLRLLGFLTDFRRLNRRMHNKSLTVDGAATIVGGRNVGDEYFAAGDGIGFVDLDVLAVGPVVAEVAQSFEAYWQCAAARPAARLLPPATPAQREALARLGDEVRALPEARHYLERVRDTRLLRDLVAGELPFEWATARLVVDAPDKALGRARRDELLLARLAGAFGTRLERELDVVSPYFVPGRRGTRSLVELARRGVRVKVLTNALESTDVAAVHSGYAKRRRALLQAGVELWELRRDAIAVARPAIGPRRAARSAWIRGSLRSGHSEASLHAKTFAVDGERLFIGSLNFDPRSAIHNTELGVVIDSPGWARDLASAFVADVPKVAYRVQLDARGRIEWRERRDDGSEHCHHAEPGASLGRRLAVALFALLPIEGLL